MVSVHRLARMLEIAAPPPPPEARSNVIPFARYLRPAETYALQSKKEEGDIARFDRSWPRPPPSSHGETNFAPLHSVLRWRNAPPSARVARGYGG
jgi:hypothetical protein